MIVDPPVGPPGLGAAAKAQPVTESGSTCVSRDNDQRSLASMTAGGVVVTGCGREIEFLVSRLSSRILSRTRTLLTICEMRPSEAAIQVEVTDSVMDLWIGRLLL